MTPPSVSGEPGDGLLTLSDVMALRLNADWVVLSACNTGAADGAGAEAVSGLGRGFFYAGARALLVTHWPVETTSAKALTVDLFRRQAADIGLNRARALRAAKLALIDAPGFMDDRGRVAFSYAHPLFWAPYSLIGDPAGGRPGS
jgi:CHAT domain-containing protein